MIPPSPQAAKYFPLYSSILGLGSVFSREAAILTVRELGAGILSPWLSFVRSSYRDRLAFSSEEESATRLNRAEQNKTQLIISRMEEREGGRERTREGTDLFTEALAAVVSGCFSRCESVLMIRQARLIRAWGRYVIWYETSCRTIENLTEEQHK
jgi:hypothetical protein